MISRRHLHEQVAADICWPAGGPVTSAPVTTAPVTTVPVTVAVPVITAAIGGAGMAGTAKPDITCEAEGNPPGHVVDVDVRAVGAAEA